MSPYAVAGNNPISLIDVDGQGPGYPDSHAVSQAIIKYNPLIFQAFKYANNTSTIQLHMLSKGQGGQDAYGKAIGAIGEGLFAQRLTSNLSETGSVLNFGQRYGGPQWREIYDYAMQNDFRFLSYGDGSLLFAQ